MKYLLLDDLSYVKSKIKYICLFYIIYLIILIFNMSKITDSFTLAYLGLYVNLDYIFMYAVYYLYSIMAPFLLGILIYNKDLKNKFDNIFTRIEKGKWYLIKNVSIILYVTIFKLFLYLISSLFIKNIFIYFIKDLLISLILINLFIFSLSLLRRYEYSFIFLFIIFLVKIKYDMFILNINNIYLFVLLILLIIINTIVNKKTINMQFERSTGHD